MPSTAKFRDQPTTSLGILVAFPPNHTVNHCFNEKNRWRVGIFVPPHTNVLYIERHPGRQGNIIDSHSVSPVGQRQGTVQGFTCI
jgi:hypothetical protein